MIGRHAPDGAFGHSVHRRAVLRLVVKNPGAGRLDGGPRFGVGGAQRRPERTVQPFRPQAGLPALTVRAESFAALTVSTVLTPVRKRGGGAQHARCGCGSS
ncbi:hypothetical protein, partial [Streptomyces sp. NPDC059957]|uniref:hypothetical protein n=1 Tax=Streptomyces sp. NPDC059957 TaxID=3347016 RepID=UPI00365043A4